MAWVVNLRDISVLSQLCFPLAQCQCGRIAYCVSLAVESRRPEMGGTSSTKQDYPAFPENERGESVCCIANTGSPSGGFCTTSPRRESSSSSTSFSSCFPILVMQIQSYSPFPIIPHVFVYVCVCLCACMHTRTHMCCLCWDMYFRS